ncbi:MAM domain-containing glycosylphosphatidylinositol anchor protein 1 isoform X2 [Aquila chrysaetos chrysaetos]|uniref:MAM domain-containing glycosylphosphatidylinositol anchor protein 1 isoform X2 n=1 Tax=Aquila chrysaetos chrysaetos TaxID=223781 RepID=UPI001176CCD4|nr:MAM domain-containing glycosylphosphatidylinositol anchor protein 1 isoform X2 [Aquila chrysaetos chrysaetos]
MLPGLFWLLFFAGDEGSALKMEMICFLFLSLVPVYSRGQGVYAPAQAQIIHAGQACVVKEDNISERVYTIREGDTLVLQCLVTGHPRPQVRWTKTAGSASDKFQETSVLNETLRIEKIQRLQGGRYYCKAENGVGVPAIKSIRVDVQYLDEPVLTVHQTISDVRGSFYQEKTVFLRCTVNSNPPARFIWKRGAETLSHSQDNGVDIYEPLYTQGETKVLKLKNLRPQDYASYTCQVSVRNVCSIPDKSITFQLTNTTAPPALKLSVNETLVVNPGDNITMQCSLTGGDPQPEVVWSHSPGPMPPNSLVQGGNLTIWRIHVEDSGYYNCTAINNVGNPAKKTVNLLVRLPPTISVPKGQSTITVREGSRAELQCEVRGKPKPPIIWSRVDKETPMPSGTMTMETYDGKLRLESVTREMSGTYKCQTARYNGFNIRPREALVQLNVQFPPVVEPAFQDVRQGVGRSVTLRCTMLKGSPMKVATSVWRFNGTLLAQPLSEQQDYSELKVDSVSQETSGSYECSISNDVGVSTCLFQVSAKAYSPEFYYDTPNPTLSQKQSKNYSYVLQWTQKEPDAVDPILKYRLEVRQLAQRNTIQTFIPVQKMEKGLLLEHILPNLKVPQSYEIRLTPITSFGAGDMAARIIRYMEPINYPSPTDNTCRFEDEKICGFMQDKMDNFDWTRQNALTQNPKRTVNTGPPTDISGTPEGYYMFIEASRPRVTGDKARLISPLYNITAKYYCVSFYYHMYGKHIGSLNLLVRVRNKRAIDTQVWSLSGNRGNMWQQAHVPINPPGPFQIIFEGVRGTSYEGDIAIDDVTLKKGDCPRKPIGPNKAVALPGSGVPALHSPRLCGPLTFFLYVLLR